MFVLATIFYFASVGRLVTIVPLTVGAAVTFVVNFLTELGPLHALHSSYTMSTKEFSSARPVTISFLCVLCDS